MEEPRWYNSAEEYRFIQGLVRDGRHREALERATQVLTAGGLGRKNEARLHTLVCRLYTEELQQACPEAVLHGEEAVRLSALVHDPWIRCEALSRLVHAYCHMGHTERARVACDEILAEVEENSAVIPGGAASAQYLYAMVAIAEEDWPAALDALRRAESLAHAEATDLLEQVRTARVNVLLESRRYAEARRLIDGKSDYATAQVSVAEGLARAWLALGEERADQAQRLVDQTWGQALAASHEVALVQCLTLKALLAEESNPAEAARLARQSQQRSLALGRQDLVRQCRRRVGHLLQPSGSTTG